MAYLECSGLYKDWRLTSENGITVSISFTAEQGSMTSIVGASGCGKSTVLRLLAGILKNDTPPEGMQPPRITLGGRDITTLPPGKRECGLVFQSGALFLHLTAEDNVAYGLLCRGMKKRDARQKAREFLELFNMKELAGRYPETLSGGEAQRVALARTLIVEPKLVLLDEPLSALDAPMRKKLAQEIVLLQKKIGFTALMVTHDIREAKLMSDRIILMEKGSMKWEGAAGDFTEDRAASNAV
ncbi:MAG: ABC transporter ATP-binding protein [Treponema sp.]|nr:ABC transporter ATP-binding protein [Treponema sp.]